MTISPLEIPKSVSGIIEIAGPCSAESREQVLSTARMLKDAGVKIFRAGVWKPRTHPGGFEGVGSEALGWLAEAGLQTGMLTATEVASRKHVTEALDAGVDILWIGARTTANPFAVQEIADAISQKNADTPVLVKNPVNPDLELWVGAIERFAEAGVTRLGAVHRGFSFYGEKLYRNSPIWQIPIELKLRYPDLPVIHDPSHTGGRRDLVRPLSEEALQMGFDGLMIECHCSPNEALSDASQQITPAELSTWLPMLDKMLERKSCGEMHQDSLQQLRSEIDAIDNQLIGLLAQRMDVSRRIGELKQEKGLKVLQPERFRDMLQKRIASADMQGLDSQFITRIVKEIHEESVKQQLKNPL